MKNQRLMWAVVVVLMGLFLLAMPVGAQEDQGSADQTATAGQQADQPSKFLTLTLGEALAILVGSGGLLMAFGKIMWDANQHPNGQSVDERMTARIDAVSDDRPYVDGLEKAYAAGNAALQKALDSSVKVLEIIAPQTGLKVDDAILRLLKNIQQPGTMVIQANDAESGKAAAQGFDTRLRAMRGDDVAGSDSAG